jgi:hypothetical protein
VKKLLWSILAIAALAGIANPCLAQGEMKPLVTVSFAGTDKLIADINLIGKLGGNADVGMKGQMLLDGLTGGKVLNTIDAKQPWGAVVLTDGQEGFSGYGFLPITDLKQLMEAVQNTPQAARLQIEEEDGAYKLQSPGGPVYIKQHGKWAVVARSVEDLANVPDDPATLLGDLPSRYDLAVRVSIKNIPDQYRGYALAQMHAGMQVGLEQMPSESEEDYALRANTTKQVMEQMTTMVNETDDILVGWKVDEGSKSTYLDVEVTAQPDSKLAKQFALSKPGTTKFAGFLSPNAAVNGCWTHALSDADVAQGTLMINEMRKRISDEITNQDLAEDQAKVATDLINDVAGIMQKTLESKRIDGGVSVYLDPAAVTLAGGFSIADGATLNKLIRQLVDEVKQSDPEIGDLVKLDAETHDGVRFHTLSMATPDAELQPIFGDSLDVVVGAGDDRLLLAVGGNAAKTLANTINLSKLNADKEVLPFQLSISVGKIAKFLAEVADEQDVKAKAAMASGMLQGAGDKDHITLTGRPIPNGARVRLEVEEGLLQVLGSMSQMLMPMGPPGGSMTTPAQPMGEPDAE